ncbi:hypothetical protein TUM4644_02880 [Shewanella colwelliana]|uniref:C-type lysozyme inhibitor domain-containing protein n=1 Tax=Shewanella colwelliana TaxID=23 RepID=A0ABQ4NX85_SHECO|nr:MliC family protein [Shewanella colwelliana]GIU17518.1 hypothetical protein TUM4644_02880 [Shewanella colwelliana]GIU38934.1 hypothetical protein TUM3794_12460 [Shewanella colwelliana]
MLDAATSIRHLLLLIASSLLLSCASQADVPRNNTQPNQADASPSYHCDSASLSSIESLICQTPQLAMLDRQLADVYSLATAKAHNEHPPVLKAEQQGWIKGRNDCWKSDDKANCVALNYQSRIVELQARYRLVESSGPFYYRCDNQAANEVVVTYFNTAPTSLIAEYGDSVSLMVSQPSASGAKYQGQNEQLWEHHGEALITWGYQAPQMKCIKLD